MDARLFVILPVALMAACGRDTDPATVTIDARNESGGVVTAEPTKESRLWIDTGGFKADVKMPGLGRMLNNADIDGVEMYPGTKVSGVNIDGAGSGDDGKFTMRFDAPADKARVGAWFRDQFAQNDFTARPTPTGFAGTKEDGDWFVLDLSDASGGHTRGEFRLGEKQR